MRFCPGKGSSLSDCILSGNEQMTNLSVAFLVLWYCKVYQAVGALNLEFKMSSDPNRNQMDR